jgi:hypothetical protein
MLKNPRLVIGLGSLGALITLTLVGWLTGFFAQVASVVSGIWANATIFFTSPLGVEHAIAALGAVIVAVVVLLIIFAIVEG